MLRTTIFYNNFFSTYLMTELFANTDGEINCKKFVVYTIFRALIYRGHLATLIMDHSRFVEFHTGFNGLALVKQQENVTFLTYKPNLAAGCLINQRYKPH